jgi:LPXTG-site transpeptidase (sortase) family protein
MLTRRTLGLAVAALALLTVACGAPAEEPGARGSGTVYRPRETPSYTASPQAHGEPAPTRAPLPTALPEPPRVAEPTVVPHDAIPSDRAAGPEAESFVIPVPSVRLPITAPLPARRVVIPTIGVDSKVIQLGTKLDRRGQIAWETAPFAVGQHKGLAGPGQNGNMVLSGHISSPNEGAVFSHLPDLKVGEGVIVATEERQFLYQVVETKVVTPDQVAVMDPTPDATATLITCVPDGIYSHRLVVTARLV